MTLYESPPLEEASVRVVQRALARLNSAADMAGRGRNSSWMHHPEYRRACLEYDLVISLVPEWKTAIARAKAIGD